MYVQSTRIQRVSFRVPMPRHALDAHSSIDRSESLAAVDFGRYGELLVERLFQAYCVDSKRIKLERSIGGLDVPIDDAIPCGLILNELLSNSLKHAFVDRRVGVISVSLRRTEIGDIKCAVADNGIGLPEDFDLDTSQSLGFQVVGSLIWPARCFVPVGLLV